MTSRLLNVASIACLTLCVALMAMWVRSYFAIDSLTGRIAGQNGLVLSSKPGRLFIHLCTTLPVETPIWSFESETDFHDWDKPFSKLWPRSGLNACVPLGFIWMRMPGGPSGGGQAFTLPYWCLVLTSGLLAIACQMRWPPWRFNLRTMLFVTTLVAVVMGMITWLDRGWIGK